MSEAAMTNYHTHTTWCDGRDTPEAMCEAALAKGFSALGFSSHSDMISDVGAYRAEIRSLAERYRGRLRVLCGLEAELGLPYARGEFDYVIGSVHYLTAPDGARVAVDHTPQILADGIRDHFGGDGTSLVKAYFALIRSTLGLDFEIVGHPDLVRKFNAKHPYFDEDAAWYRAELAATAEAIAASGKLVEVNTGAIARGWLDDAYPSPEFRRLLRERGVRFVLSSDAHASEALDGAFDRFASAESYVDVGRRVRVALTGGIACGKSLVARLLREFGVETLDADDIVHEILPDAGERRRIAAEVFADPKKRRALESRLHPQVKARLDAWLSARAKTADLPRMAIIPLLYEAHWDDSFDIVVCVASDRARQIERMMETRGYSRTEAEERLAAQLPVEEKVRRADYTVENDGSVDDLKSKVAALVSWLRSKSSCHPLGKEGWFW